MERSSHGPVGLGKARAVGAALLVMGVLVGTGCASQESLPATAAPTAEDRTATAAPTAEDQTAGVGSWPLDDIPGLGVSEAAAQRDELIAYWEAYRRDELVEQCMREAGFVWYPEALYPEPVVVKIANAMGVQLPVVDVVPQKPPAVRNREVEASLDPGERDRYFRVLFGESAADVQYVRESGGALPPNYEGVGGFATSGCVGDAEDLVGSVWDLKKRLADELARFRSDARRSDAFLDAVDEYTACFADKGYPGIAHPEQVEALLAEPGQFAKVAEAEATCRSLWFAADRAGLEASSSDFREQYSEILTAQVDRYSQALEQIRNDAGFLAFLARENARISADARD